MKFFNVELCIFLVMMALLPTGVSAAEWQSGRYTVLAADLNADSDQDIFLQAVPATENIPGPYDIAFDVAVKPKIDNVILQNNGNNTYTVIYQPANALVTSVTWAVGAHQALYADFDGDGNKDVLLQAVSINANSLVLLAPKDGVAPFVNQVITGTALGLDLAVNNAVTLTASDINDDGRSDLLAKKTGQSDRVSLADANGYLLPLLAGSSICYISGDLDSDCDGIIDIKDDFPFDPTKTTDTDNDGIADNLDADDDGDGIADAADTGVNANGVSVSYALDSLNGQQVGGVEGEFSVSASGKPNYSIPIMQTPSVNNIARTLSVTYSGQSGNGLLGMGWYLDGLSKITRCTTTLARDGFVNPINFDSSDRFCLNGEHLVAVNGVYGVSGTEYRTENESYSKVISSGQQGCSPVSFEVWRKDGRIEYYGVTPNSRRVISRKVKNTTNGGCDGGANVSAVAEWAINKLKDREGNEATYQYINDTVNGSYLYIDRIDFNANSTRFEYEARTDITKQYGDGHLDELSVRLKKIHSYVGATKFKSYYLTYAYGGATGRSRLTQMKECTGDTCLQPMMFTWDSGTETPAFTQRSTETDTAFTASSYQDQKFQLGDVNGDGQQDIIWTYLTSTNQLGRVVYQANAAGSSGFTKVSAAVDAGYLANSIPVDRQDYIVGDVNGDGLDDLVWMAQDNSSFIRAIYLSNGIGFDSQGYEVDTASVVTNSKYQLGDVNGDGRKDLVWTYVSQHIINIKVYLAYTDSVGRVAFGKASTIQDGGFAPDNYLNNSFDLADVNGDGRSDLVYTFVLRDSFARVLYLANSNGGGFIKTSLDYDESLLAAAKNMSRIQVQLGDVNGDGGADIIWTFVANNQLGFVTYLADVDGLGFTKKTAELKTIAGISPQDYQSSKISSSDINGDGKTDLNFSYQSDYSFGWVSFLATQDGEGFVYGAMGSQSLANPTYANQEYLLGDVSGDGKTDLVWAYTNNTNGVGRISSVLPQSHPDHIVEIADSLGAKIKIAYRYMAEETFYTRGITATYPKRNDTGLSYLVSNVQKSNGRGGFNAWDYKYQGATTDLTGRGFLGFEKRIVTNNQTGFITTDTYRLPYPYMGQLQSTVVEKTIGVPIQKTFNHWKSVQVPYNGGTIKTDLRYLDDSVSLTYDLTTPANLTKVEVTENTYNPVTGNLTNSVVSTGLGFNGAIDAGYDQNGNFARSHLNTEQGAVTTSNLYTDDTSANWRLSFLTRTDVTAERPGLASKAYAHTYSPYNSTSFLLGSKTEFYGSNVWRTAAYGYDTYGNITSESVTAADYSGGSVGPYLTTYGAYTNGLFPSSKTNAKNQIERYSYNAALGLPDRVTDINGLVTTFGYDGLGRVVAKRSPDGTVTRNSYSPCTASCTLNGHTIKYTTTTTVKNPANSNAGAPPTVASIDMLGRVVRTSTLGFSGASILVDTVFDALGRKSSVSEPYLSGQSIYSTTYGYDNLDRVTSELEPDGGSKTNVYSADVTYGSKVYVTATLKKSGTAIKTITSLTQFNSYQQMAGTTDGLGIKTLFYYDAQGMLRSTKVDFNVATAITVVTDVAGNKTQLIDPDAGTINYAYDGFGRVRLETQSPGSLNHTTLTGYDALNRVTSKTYSGVGSPQAFTWIYDSAANGKGLLASVSGPNYQKVLGYDGLSRVNSEAISINGETTAKAFSYGYDNYSRLSRKTWPSGFAVKYAFNANGYALNVQDAANDTLYWQATAMDARGNVTGESFGNGVSTVKAFDASNGLAQTIQTGISGNATSFQNMTYQWDTAGNLYQRTSHSGLGENTTEDFTYDNGHRLATSVTSGSVTRSLSNTYDNLGNISSKTGVGTYTYAAAQPHAVSATAGAVNASYLYDSKGNMTTNAGRLLTYSVFNLPLTISEGATQTQFRYGADEKLIWQNTLQNGISTDTRYYEGDYEEVQQGDTIRAKTSVNGIVVYSTVQKVDSQAKGSDLSYLHTDHLGSTDSVTNKTAQLDTRMLFDPFGFRRKDNGADADAAYLASLQKTTFETTSKGYTGHEQIDSASLVHMGGRMYDPVLGRFLSPDDYVQFPEISQSYNRYSYVMNNPLSMVDPSGEQSAFVGGARPKEQVSGDEKQNVSSPVNAGVDANAQGGEKPAPSSSDAKTTKKQERQAKARAQAEDDLKNPNVKKTLHAIRQAEFNHASTEDRSEDKMYTQEAGFKDLPNLDDHPAGSKADKNAKQRYSGAYQIGLNTWSGVKEKLGLTDFSRHSQDLAAVSLMGGPAVNQIKSGNIDAAIPHLAGVWGSVPEGQNKGSVYPGQAPATFDTFKAHYDHSTP